MPSKQNTKNTSDRASRIPSTASPSIKETVQSKKNVPTSKSTKNNAKVHTTNVQKKLNSSSSSSSSSFRNHHHEDNEDEEKNNEDTEDTGMDLSNINQDYLDSDYSVNSEDDISIDENDVFDSEDERLYGPILNPILERQKQYKNDLKEQTKPSKLQQSRSEEDDDEGDEDEEDIDDDDAYNDDDDEEENEDDITVLDIFNANLEKAALLKQQKNSSNGVTSTNDNQHPDQRKRNRDDNDTTEDEDDDDDDILDNDDDDDDDVEPLLTDEQHQKLLTMIQQLETHTSSSSTTASTTTTLPNIPTTTTTTDKKKRRVTLPEQTLSNVNENEYFTVTNHNDSNNFSKQSLRAQAVAAALGLLQATDNSSSSSSSSSTATTSIDSLDLGVDIGSLASSLSSTEGFSTLRKRLERLVGQSVLVNTSTTTNTSNSTNKNTKGSSRLPIAPIPLAPPVSEVSSKRVSRSEAYQETSNYVGKKWTDLVAINRQAPHLSYSAEANGDSRPVLATTSSLASRFNPMNTFEATIAATLAASGMGAVPNSSIRTHQGKLTTATGDAGVLMAERAELAANTLHTEDIPIAPINPQALRERQAALAKMRALLFYDEIKRRRINKIKSKTYRRLRKRADLRKGTDKIQQLQDEDPEAAKALLEEEARIIAKERITLKHRAGGKGVGGSKWVKRVLARGGGNGKEEGSREDLIAHQRRAEALQARVRGDKARRYELNENDDDENNDEYRNNDDDNEDYSNDSDTEDDDYDKNDAEVMHKGRTDILASVGLTKSNTAMTTGDNTSNDATIPTKGLFAMRFMRQAAERSKEQAQREALDLANDMERQEHVLERMQQNRSEWLKDDDEQFNDMIDNYKDSNDDFDRQNPHLREELDDDDAENDGDHGDEDDVAGEDTVSRSKKNAVAKTLAQRKKLANSTDTVLSSTIVGRHSYGGTALQAGETVVRKNSTNPVVSKDGTDTVTHTAITTIPIDIVVSNTAGTNNSTTVSHTVSNPWLNATKFLGTNTEAFLGTENKTNSSATMTGVSSTTLSSTVNNPWLAGENVFSTGELGTRHTASKRANEAVKQSSSSMDLVIDVQGTLNDLSTAKTIKNNKDSVATFSTHITSSKVPSSQTGTTMPTSMSKPTPSTTIIGKAKLTDKVGIAAEQEELIKRAFIGSGVATEDELLQEKEMETKEMERNMQEALLASSGGKRNNNRLKYENPSKPGWGSWTGLGADIVNTQEQLRKIKNNGKNKQRNQPSATVTLLTTGGSLSSRKGTSSLPLTTTTRKDKQLMNVILSERYDSKLASAHQATSIPHQYRTTEEYEAALRQPLGKEWNTLTSTTELTKPEWVTKAGLIIQPIQHSTITRGKGETVARAGSKVASVGQGKKKVR